MDTVSRCLPQLTSSKTIFSSSLRMLSSLWKECTFPDGTADQCADQARTACHANLSACRRRTPRAGSDRRVTSERSRLDASLDTFRSTRVLGVRRQHAPKILKKRARPLGTPTVEQSLLTSSGPSEPWSEIESSIIGLTDSEPDSALD